MALVAGAHAAAELVVYEHDSFGGRSYRVNAQMTNLKSVDFNDMASSVVVRNGSWQLCGDAGFRGQCVTLSPGSYRSLSEMGLNDRISSMRPIGNSGNSGGDGSWGGGWGGSSAAVELYENANYNGRSFPTQGSANLKNQGFNDKVSSIVIRSGRWEFCSDADYRGHCVTLGPGSYTNLSDMNFNDRISSLRPSSGPPAYGSGRPQSGGWGGDDGSAPEINMSSNRSGRVTFHNGCVAYYNASGQRFQNLPACHGNQVRRADEAMARYRSEQGLDRADSEHPWASSPGFSGNDPTPPEIIMGTNREGEVIFRNNCVAYYNAQGRRWRQQPSCNANQIRQADQAMAAYRREQGM
jgi:hypothetical protein